MHGAFVEQAFWSAGREFLLLIRREDLLGLRRGEKFLAAGGNERFGLRTIWYFQCSGGGRLSV